MRFYFLMAFSPLLKIPLAYSMGILPPAVDSSCVGILKVMEKDLRQLTSKYQLNQPHGKCANSLQKIFDMQSIPACMPQSIENDIVVDCFLPNDPPGEKECKDLGGLLEYIMQNKNEISKLLFRLSCFKSIGTEHFDITFQQTIRGRKINDSYQLPGICGPIIAYSQKGKEKPSRLCKVKECSPLITETIKKLQESPVFILDKAGQSSRPEKNEAPYSKFNSEFVDESNSNSLIRIWNDTYKQIPSEYAETKAQVACDKVREKLQERMRDTVERYAKFRMETSGFRRDSVARRKNETRKQIDRALRGRLKFLPTKK